MTYSAMHVCQAFSKEQPHICYFSSSVLIASWINMWMLLLCKTNNMVDLWTNISAGGELKLVLCFDLCDGSSWLICLTTSNGLADMAELSLFYSHVVVTKSSSWWNFAKDPWRLKKANRPLLSFFFLCILCVRVCICIRVCAYNKHWAKTLFN